jgi:hypothetical protein
VSPVKYELDFYIPEENILHSHRRKNFKCYLCRSTPNAPKCKCLARIEPFKWIIHHDSSPCTPSVSRWSLKDCMLECLSEPSMNDTRHFRVLYAIVWRQTVVLWSPHASLICFGSTLWLWTDMQIHLAWCKEATAKHRSILSFKTTVKWKALFYDNINVAECRHLGCYAVWLL